MKKPRVVFFSTFSLPLPNEQEEKKTPEEEYIDALLSALHPGCNPLRAMEKEKESWPIL